jgi:hypothetical protein
MTRSSRVALGILGAWCLAASARAVEVTLELGGASSPAPAYTLTDVKMAPRATPSIR